MHVGYCTEEDTESIAAMLPVRYNALSMNLSKACTNRAWLATHAQLCPCSPCIRSCSYPLQSLPYLKSG